MKLALDIPQNAIADFCRKHQIRKLSVFGSILRDDFRDDSDVDFLVEYEDGHAPRSFNQLFEAEDELAALVGRNVDLVNAETIRNAENPYRRALIMNTARTSYDEIDCENES